MTCYRCEIPASLTVEKILFIVEIDAMAKHRWGWIDTAFERVPAPMRPSLYKSLSRVLHPDAGGDADAMTMLNAAHERHK